MKKIIGVLISFIFLTCCKNSGDNKNEAPNIEKDSNRSEIDSVLNLPLKNRPDSIKIEKAINIEEDTNYVKTDSIIEINLKKYPDSVKIREKSLKKIHLNKDIIEIIDRQTYIAPSYDSNYSSLSILIKKNGKYVNEICQDKSWTSLETVDIHNIGFEEWREIENVECIHHAQNNKMVVIKLGYYPSAPGGETFALISLNNDEIKPSKTYHIDGYLQCHKDDSYFNHQTGYFTFDVPLKIKQTSKSLKIELNHSKIEKKGRYAFLKISKNDRLKFAKENKTIELIEDINSETPTFIKLDIKEGMSIVLDKVAFLDATLKNQKHHNSIFIDYENSLFQDVWKNGMYLLKVKIGEKEGWTRSQKHYRLIGCEPVG
ncbi:hypothetical protein [Flavivirga algicola]|uniref:Lipoprotein n=1 Tax=Flavivirga algicola TaxID=2729136 RepID=A0ABX1RVW8_9FLAO|nr:hypothetical protein [Flavivirga algicola]NMH87706.1 hypothetical protein [Flavivirga algicola]